MRLFALATIVVLAACTGHSGGKPVQPKVTQTAAQDHSKELPQLKKKILTQLGTKQCSSNKDCKAKALGNRPCGGPREYLIVSVTDIDENQLDQMLSKYEQMDRENNSFHQMMGTCVAILPPKPKCQNKVCVAKSPQKGKGPRLSF